MHPNVTELSGAPFTSAPVMGSAARLPRTKLGAPRTRHDAPSRNLLRHQKIDEANDLHDEADHGICQGQKVPVATNLFSHKWLPSERGVRRPSPRWERTSAGYEWCLHKGPARTQRTFPRASPGPMPAPEGASSNDQRFGVPFLLWTCIPPQNVVAAERRRSRPLEQPGSAPIYRAR